MIDMRSQASEFYYRGQRIAHTYYFWTKQNIFFCNIPKCATQSIREYVEGMHISADDPYYFTIVRDPIKRLFSALWMIHTLVNNGEYTKACPPNIKNFVQHVDRRTAFDGPFAKHFMHALPQTEFIKHSPFIGDTPLKIFRLDQVNSIFDAEIEVKHRRKGTHEAKDRSQWDSVFRSFSDTFDKELVEYRSFINTFYKEDIALWEKVNESK